MRSIELSPDQKKKLQDYIRNIVDNALPRQAFDIQRDAIDRALKQQYEDSEPAAPLIPLNSSINNVEQYVQTDTDQFSNLFSPTLLRIYRTLVSNVKNLCFPANGDWVTIDRKYSTTLSQLGLEKFIGSVNEAWVNILKTENQRFGFKSKYATNICELIAYGNTFLTHVYDVDNHYVNVIQPGVRNFGLYPISNNWRESNLVYYYDINYTSALLREDLDQELLAAVRPSEDMTSSETTARMGSNRKITYEETNIPFGKLRFHDIFLPSVYIPGINDEDDLILSNVYVTAIIDPVLKSGETSRVNDGDLSMFILKIRQDVNPWEHGIVCGSYSDNMPSTFYNQGPLIPYIFHQAIINQLFRGTSRLAAFAADPSMNQIRQDGMLDPDWTENDTLEYGKIYPPGYKLEPIIALESLAAGIATANSTAENLESKIESGVGLSKAQMGIYNTGRKSATEIKEATSGGQLQITDVAGAVDELLRGSVTNRMQLEMQMLTDQVKATISVLDTPDALELALRSNPLFLRLLSYSGLEHVYEDFYRQTQKQILEDKKIALQIQGLQAQADSLIAFANTEQQLPPDIDVAQAQMLYQQSIAARQQALQQAEQLALQIQQLELMFKGVIPPPEPSYSLYYQLLTAPFSDSDITVIGSMSTMSKQIAFENMQMFMQSLANFPPEVIAQLDFTGIMQVLARSNDIPLNSLLKSSADVEREAQAAQAQAAQQQQMMMQASQVPGAQPPQFG